MQQAYEDPDREFVHPEAYLITFSPQKRNNLVGRTSYWKMLESLGLAPPQIEIPKQTHFNAEQILEKAKTVADTIGRTPSQDDWQESRNYILLPSIETVVYHFNSWNEFVERAGLKPNPWRGKPYRLRASAES